MIDEAYRKELDAVIAALSENERDRLNAMPEARRYLWAAIKDMYLPDYRDESGTKPPLKLIVLDNGGEDYFALDGNKRCEGCKEAVGLVDIVFGFIDPAVSQERSATVCRDCTLSRAARAIYPVVVEVFVSKYANPKSRIVQYLIDNTQQRARTYLINSTFPEGASITSVAQA
jgi:hypothetical protein